MKRLISLAAACAAAITLSACSTESPVPSEASKSAASSTDIQQVPAEEILAEFDLEGLDGPEIIDKLEPHIRDISYRTYFRKRQMAIDALSSVLWGYSSKESLALLEKFVPEANT